MALWVLVICHVSWLSVVDYWPLCYIGPMFKLYWPRVSVLLAPCISVLLAPVFQFYWPRVSVLLVPVFQFYWPLCFRSIGPVFQLYWPPVFQLYWPRVSVLLAAVFQFYGYLSQQQNMMQDYIRTATYQRAMLDNSVDFQDKVGAVSLRRSPDAHTT